MSTEPWSYTPTAQPEALPADVLDWNPSFDGPEADNPDPADEPVVITQGQLDNLRGLMTDLRTICGELEAEYCAHSKRFLDSPLSRTDWAAFHKAQGFGAALGLIRWAIAAHDLGKDEG